MSRPLRAEGAVAAVLLVLSGCRALPPHSSKPATSAPADQRASGDTFRTPWGGPDLQGIWTDEFQTPLQRPARLAGKEFFTDEERAKLDELRLRIPRADDRPAPRGSEQDVSGAYPSVFNSVKPTGRRTSLI